MALRTKSARRTSDRVEDLAAWVLVAAGLFVVLFSYGFGTQFYDQGLERARVESAERSRRPLDSFRRAGDQLHGFAEQHRMVRAGSASCSASGR